MTGLGMVMVSTAEVLVADHVGLDALQSAVGVPLGGKVPGAVEGVASGPLIRVVGRLRNGLFAIVEDESDGVALGRVCAEVLAERDEQALV